jgi:Rrf2 family protein
MRISTKSQYGLRAIVFLARSKEKICPLRVISKKEGLSFDYLEKIIAKLEKAGLVKSKKGSQGGYFLAKKPERIKIGKIILALEGKGGLVKCIAKERRYRCPLERKCLTKGLWQKIQSSIEKTLNSITLADLIKK